jgi:uncharacterized cupin superfamily protein
MASASPSSAGFWARLPGAEKLGCSLFEVAPGKRAWPFHYHFANEEALYILEGSATLRLGAEEFQLSQGYFVALRSGPKSWRSNPACSGIAPTRQGRGGR